MVWHASVPLCICAYKDAVLVCVSKCCFCEGKYEAVVQHITLHEGFIVDILKNEEHARSCLEMQT